MKVQIVRAWNVWSVGDVIDVPEGMGTELCNTGRAVRCDEQVIETAAVEPDEVRTAAVTQRRKRK